MVDHLSVTPYLTSSSTPEKPILITTVMTDKHNRGPADNRTFVRSRRSILYAIGFALIFAITCADLALISQQLHKYGNHSSNYPSTEYRNVLGLGVAAAVVSLLLCFLHFRLRLELTAFFSFVLAVLFGTVAGVIHRDKPFRGSSCNAGQSANSAIFQRLFMDCRRIMAIEGLSWALLGLYTLMLIGTLRYMLKFARRTTPGGHYGSNARSVA
ncbi:hypothetical protein D9619_013391 [Psilocybe cf. subviscida]|uniref:MARVEL domain-containing protein n=1 Tax=Psilocybe cf. subviscida TaxID=2480587 RepID=A0A8H5BS64_9AGAR|nr:hypothetical protein D9619_013391 [Psilocybe cf. subviscida]